LVQSSFYLFIWNVLVNVLNINYVQISNLVVALQQKVLHVHATRNIMSFSFSLPYYYLNVLYDNMPIERDADLKSSLPLVELASRYEIITAKMYICFSNYVYNEKRPCNNQCIIGWSGWLQWEWMLRSNGCKKLALFAL